MTYKDKCDLCGETTAFGSGRFVNRVPSSYGWNCAECLAIECDRCGEPIPLDEDFRPHYLHEDWLEFPDGAQWIHEECVTKDDLGMLISQLSCEVTEANSKDDLVAVANRIQDINI